MKRIFSFLFAIIALVGTTSIFTACQEDAPEINFTINVTVNNDFTEVVNAINNGTMKQEAAIAALTAAIEKMQGEQDAKLEAIVEAINTLATTLDAKLAIIEAAMKAQTLALETKLGLIEAAIKALPDYSDKLAAIETAIAALPNYSEQLGAIAAAIEALPNYTEQMGALETALEAIAANIEAQEGQYADELAALTDAIDDITAAVEAGNKSQEDALAEIIALLESGALAGGGSGSEGGEGEGGEGESTIPTVSFITSKAIGETISINLNGSHTLSEVVGAKHVSSTQNMFTITHTYELTSQAVILRGEKLNIRLFLDDNGITSLDLSKAPDMTTLGCSGNELTHLDVSKNKKLGYLACSDNPITPENMTKLVNDLVDRTGLYEGTFCPKSRPNSEYPKATVSDVEIATGKNWKVCYNDHSVLYPGE